MIQRQDIVKEATDWLNTPFHDQQRLKGYGVDCAQLIAGIAENLNIIEKNTNIPTYVVDWHIHHSDEKLLWYLKYFKCVKKRNKDDYKLGDILTFKFGRCTSHLAIYVGDNRILHADKRFGKVICHNLDDDLKNRHTTTWKFPGVR